MRTKKITIATGLVNPKTTSLFFDKLWIPQDKVIDYQEDIPSDVIFRLDSCAKKITRRSYKPFYIHTMANTSMRIEDIDFSKYSYQNSPIAFPIDLLGESKIKYSNLTFKSSKNRNEGIKRLTDLVKQDYGIDIVPIYIDSCSFEFDFEGQTGFYSQTNTNPIVIAMEFVPTIIEDKLEWDQILDIRKDKRSIMKLHNFRTWVNANLLNSSQEEIEAKYLIALDEYKEALKKHGIMTTVGAFSIVFDALATIVEHLESEINGSVAAGITVATGLSVFTFKQFYNYFENKAKPIAYVYDLINKTK